MEIVYIGKILRAYGLKGNVVIFAYADMPRSFRVNLKVAIDPEGEPIEMTVKSVSKGSGGLRVGFKEINDRTSAENIAGKYIGIPQEDLPELSKDEYYVFDLIGCKVNDHDGSELGIVDEVINNPGNDLLQVSRNKKQYLIPVNREIVKNIDLKNRSITVENIEGLFD